MKSSELLKRLQRDGWYIAEQQPGSHFLMCHPTKKAPTPTGCISVTFHGSSEVGKGLASKLLKQAGLK
ncbi:type II toxin-antitoxin system HicA family toxin [Hymenobacter lapidiphilus]|uniref:Type II toxin-antitoxin system HicA family toxin n=1 Tax=Hymenobacter lapidiphilus TaxID=2608003 RepID=A0A7Y7PSN6_9BACT|nr:type II toxin-antitoxin system HicA family toxin [Hymenobacter lapidiphilus]NVO33142.1 type II toxin-antitoxin system HicA family toxin [Hymenobacter lapidiphilus]